MAYRLRVKEEAELRGYNMSSLSRASNISFTTIKRIWRNDRHDVSVEVLNKIAMVLNVATGYLIEDVEEEK